jgi:uncharacterized tellurite resistance protein B-like protein
MTEQLATCLLVAKVLVADGIMTPGERVFLARVMDAQHLSAEERRAVAELEGLDDVEAWCARLPEPDRRAILDRVVEAALVDGHLGPHEIEAVRTITTLLGLG